MNRAVAEFERYLHAQIPLTQAMAISVMRVDDQSVRLRAALAPNLNHQQSAFGGSIATLAITAAWAYVHVRLRREGWASTVVIQRNSVDFLAPARNDIEAHCAAPSALQWARFIDVLKLKGKARIDMHAAVEAGDVLVARFEGRYVALRD